MSDSYEQGSKVRFTCSKPGYIPINPQPIECVEQPECKVVKPLGITSGRIPDSAINATSERGNYEARNIRYLCRPTTSVADPDPPDPRVFGSPRSGSGSEY